MEFRIYRLVVHIYIYIVYWRVESSNKPQNVGCSAKAEAILWVHGDLLLGLLPSNRVLATRTRTLPNVAIWATAPRGERLGSRVAVQNGQFLFVCIHLWLNKTPSAAHRNGLSVNSLILLCSKYFHELPSTSIHFAFREHHLIPAGFGVPPSSLLGSWLRWSERRHTLRH